ncbi:MAG: aminopeptidase P family protein [Chloroflexi bacterium]|nr:aminopeptidase P family protein [Chloroflexota bacterium]
MSTTQVIPENFIQVSKAERDRRWKRVRDEMVQRGVDCLLVMGSSGRWNEMHANLRYVANYADNLSTLSYAIFPLQGEGTLVTQMSIKRSNLAQCWFSDIRGQSTRKLPEILAERLGDLNLLQGSLGLAGLTFLGGETIGLPWNLREAIHKKLPHVKMVDMTDMFFTLRAVKSDEEVACLANSARLSDIAFEAKLSLARPGVTERELYAGMIYAVEAAGAEPPTFLVLNSGSMPGGPLMGDPSPSNRVLQPGDVLCSEIGPKWAGYQAQGSQTVVLGKASPVLHELAQYGAEVWHKIVDKLRPGNSYHEALHAGDDIIRAVRWKLGDLAESFHPIAHGAGLNGPDPEPPFDELQPNQAFNVHIGHGAPTTQHLFAGCCVATTKGEARPLSKYPIEELLLAEAEKARAAALDDKVLDGARRVLAAAVEEEVVAFLGRHRYPLAYSALFRDAGRESAVGRLPEGNAGRATDGT